MREQGSGGFQHDSLDFGSSRGRCTIIAGAVGLMANDAQVELILWARGDSITYREPEPFAGALRPSGCPFLNRFALTPTTASGVMRTTAMTKRPTTQRPLEPTHTPL